MRKNYLISFDIPDWVRFQWIAAKIRGNGKFNPSRLYQGFSKLNRAEKGKK